MVTEEGQIVESILGFYRNFFRKSEGEGGGFDGVEWSPLDRVAVEELEIPFTEDEIKISV